MDWSIIAIIIGVAVVVVIGIGFSIIAERKRREGLERAAEEMGLVFFPEGNDILFDQLGGFRLFNQGHARKMKNLIQGDSGEVKIAIFDYIYKTGSGDKQATHRVTVALLQSNQLQCPDFTMRPEGVFDKIGSALGFQDIDFDSHPEFSNLFVLQGSNEEAVRKFFTPRLLEFFQSKPGISVEAIPGMMFFYRSRHRVKPAELKELLSQAYEVFGYMVDRD
jgi:hypothetical protein